MKRILLAATLGVMLLSSANISAKPQNERSIVPMLKQLDLSRMQRQEIRAIMTQLREDNSLYTADKAEIKLQKSTLFALDVWDEALANDIVVQQISSSSQVSLNTAIARHKAFQVLTDEQRNELSERQISKDREKRRQRKISKLNRRLNLSAIQTTELENLMAAQATAVSAFDSEISGHKQAEKALLQADEFDQDAWNTLNSNYANTQTRIHLINLETHFNFRKILSETQLRKLNKMGNRKKQRQRKAE